MKNVNKLDWDSEFFQKNIGEIDCNRSKLAPVDQSFDLIYVKNCFDPNFHITDFYLNHQETKVVFSKIVEEKQQPLTIIKDTDNSLLTKERFYPIAFESGKFSRFKLDSNFSKKDFEKLYSIWVDKSIAKEIADKVFYLEEKNELKGFITLKQKETDCLVGLFGIDIKFQGKGLGTTLLNVVEDYCSKNGIEKLIIPTQKENLPACAFYLKYGFEIIEEINIKHFWRNTYK